MLSRARALNAPARQNARVLAEAIEDLNGEIPEPSARNWNVARGAGVVLYDQERIAAPESSVAKRLELLNAPSLLES